MHPLFEGVEPHPRFSVRYLSRQRRRGKKRRQARTPEPFAEQRQTAMFGVIATSLPSNAKTNSMNAFHDNRQLDCATRDDIVALSIAIERRCLGTRHFTRCEASSRWCPAAAVLGCLVMGRKMR
jgi:hypothetical protein